MRVAMIAGEASGDLLGAGLIRALRSRYADLVVEGVGGPEMQAEGCESLYPMERLSVMGLVETLGRLTELLAARRRLVRRFLDRPPDVFVGVDAPDFNLAVARRLRGAGIRTAHYVSPSVWAWRRYRIRRIVASVDLMLTLFPFEATFYREHGMRVECVGHPLADAIADDVDRAGARRALSLPAHGEMVALLPGSRQVEVRLLGETLLDTVAWLVERRPGLGFVAPMVNPEVEAVFSALLRRSPHAAAVKLVRRRAREVMAASDVVLLASGTATLEAMLLKKPMVITYRINPLTYALVHRVIAANIDHVGLPNLLAGRALVPELLQDEARPERLGAAVLSWLESPARVAELVATFRRLHGSLRRNADTAAAAAVAELVEGGG